MEVIRFNFLLNFESSIFCVGICHGCGMKVWSQTKRCHICRESIKELVQYDNEGIQEGDEIPIIKKTVLAQN